MWALSQVDAFEDREKRCLWVVAQRTDEPQDSVRAHLLDYIDLMIRIAINLAAYQAIASTIPSRASN